MVLQTAWLGVSCPWVEKSKKPVTRAGELEKFPCFGCFAKAQKREAYLRACTEDTKLISRDITRFATPTTVETSLPE